MLQKDKLPKNDLAKHHILDEDQVNAENYPRLKTISSAFVFQFQAVPDIIAQPEYAYIPEHLFKGGKLTDMHLFISQWNLSWESAQTRFDLFDEDIPKPLEWLKKFEGHNLYLIPFGKENKYGAYSPIYNLLPAKLLTAQGLPLLSNGLWPASPYRDHFRQFLPSDFPDRLSKAFSAYMWPLLNYKYRMFAYNSSDPIKVLAHNLDFWIPYVNKAIEQRIRTFSTCDVEDEAQKKLINKVSKSAPSDITIKRPLKGGIVWYGEEEAWEMAKEIIETADKYGKLRSIIDAIKSHRIEDDFSDRWSYEKEDFERKLFKKRSKYKVKFVELNDTIAVQGHETEVIDNMFWEDFVGLLDKKEKQVVILIRNGHTKVGEISKILGYANHSPVSKALKRIRKRLEKYIDNS